jgi:hypothetical protein
MRMLEKKPKPPMGTPQIVMPARVVSRAGSWLEKGPELLAEIADI